MSQHDYVLENQDGASFRADINSALAAIATVNSGPTAPTTTFAEMLWQDTTTGVLKQRNAGNTAWLEVYPIPAASILPAKLAQPLTLGTSQATTSGAFKDFLSIPTWVERITVSFQGVSTSGASSVLVQLGSGSPTTSGYLGTSAIIGSASASANLSSGFRVFFNLNDAAAAVRHGAITITNITGNVWAASGVLGLSDSAWSCIIGGSVSLAGVLDRIRITTVNGTDTFDAGAVNILYE